MILVSVGTHTAGFERLVKLADEAAAFGQDRWVAQIGWSRTLPHRMEWFRFCSKPEFDDLMNRASWLVTHGGYVLVEAVLAGKPVVSVPRRTEYGEVIDNHQVDFVQKLVGKGAVSTASNPRELADIVKTAPDEWLESAAALRAEMVIARNRLRRYVASKLASILEERTSSPRNRWP